MTGSLAEQDKRIDDLRMFEREYRHRLKTHLRGLLAELDAGTEPAEPLFRQVRGVLADPGTVLPRQRDCGLYQDAPEPFTHWQARAVLAALEPYLTEEARRA